MVGSPNTLSSDGGWRQWMHWVGDHAAFATANALPLCPWEDPNDDEFLSRLDTSELAPIEDPLVDPQQAVIPGGDEAGEDEFGLDSAAWGAAAGDGVFAHTSSAGGSGQMRQALEDVAVSVGDDFVFDDDIAGPGERGDEV